MYKYQKVSVGETVANAHSPVSIQLQSGGGGGGEGMEEGGLLFPHMILTLSSSDDLLHPSSCSSKMGPSSNNKRPLSAWNDDTFLWDC